MFPSIRLVLRPLLVGMSCKRGIWGLVPPGTFDSLLVRSKFRSSSSPSSRHRSSPLLPWLQQSRFMIISPRSQHYNPTLTHHRPRPLALPSPTHHCPLPPSRHPSSCDFTTCPHHTLFPRTHGQSSAGRVTCKLGRCCFSGTKLQVVKHEVQGHLLGWMTFRHRLIDIQLTSRPRSQEVFFVALATRPSIV